MKPFVAVIFLLFALGQMQAQREPSLDPKTPPKKPLTVEEIYAPGGVTGREPETTKWSPDSSQATFVLRDVTGDHADLWSLDPGTGEKKILVSDAKLTALAPSSDKIKDEREKERVNRYHVAAYDWAPDSKHILFNSGGQLWFYDLASATALQMTFTEKPAQDPKFSPDGSKLAYLQLHDLHVRNVSGKDDDKSLTKDGGDNLLNGEVDWLYAEELSVRSNYFWSPDSREIAFLQSNESRVPTYPIVNWLPTHPTVDPEKYPKAGDQNPEVRLGVLNAENGKLKWISLLIDADTYIPRFGWVRPGILWAQVLNRKQDQMDLYFVDAHSGKSRKVLTESSPDAWVNVNDDFRILKSGDRFLWSSWRDGNTHLYLYSFDKVNPLKGEAKLERQITHGDFEVLGVEVVDEEMGVVYFASNLSDYRQEQIGAAKLDGSKLQDWEVNRLTLDIGSHHGIFSPNAKYYIDSFSSVKAPSRMSVCGIKFLLGAPASDSIDLPCHVFHRPKDLTDYNPNQPLFLTFRADDDTILFGQLLMPPDMAKDATAKIPLIVNVYGGPAAQLVQNTWGGSGQLFNQILMRRGFAVFSVDNRGTPNRGRKFSAAIRGQFGGIELKDQLRALDTLLKSYPQLDPKRIGIWGWSNGASMTLYAMTHSDRFKAGIAVAPVTDWHDYDSAYTERYMGLPKDNAKGYDLSMPHAAADLRGSLFLVHGTSDDNVHMQNSIQMIDALVKAGKPFRLMIYPNKTHGISGQEARTHLFNMMLDHWEKELK